jgi:hypothetical protein
MKRALKATALSAALVLLAGAAASAATIDINLYGASAQYLFWNDAADNFLTGQGCTNVEQAQDATLKHGITKGTCGADTVYVRYSAKASFDGIYSCKGQVPPDGQESCAASGPRYREMANQVTWAGPPPAMGTVTSLSCQVVGIGASDVAGATFGQSSHGQLKGHQGGGYIDRSIPAIDTTGMTFYRPLVVPFGFFANTAAGITNLTRLQALLIFSGKAENWSDFGPSYANKDIIACLRHAGSGTHASLDAAVMRGDWPLVTYEDAPYIYFNDGSSDEMKCVNQNAGQSTSSFAAVGYADADQELNCGPGKTYASTAAVNHEGVPALKDNIKNGVYNFWSAQWCYECAPSNTTLHPWVQNLMTFASDAANLPASKAAYWASNGEMNVEKANDFAMPQFKP